MKNIVSILAISLSLNSLAAQDVVVKGPDEKLQLVVFVQDEETPCYSVTYNGKAMLEKSPLGDRKSTRLNSSHRLESRMPSSA